MNQEVQGGQIHQLKSKINQITQDKSILEEYIVAKKNLNSTKNEKEQVSKDKDKITKTQDLLELLYQDLVNQYNAECDINKDLITKQKDKRQQLADQFQERIKDIQTKLQGQNQERFERQQTHEEFEQKLKEIQHRTATKQLIFNTEIQKRDLEFQIKETTLRHELQLIEEHAGQADTFKEEVENQKEVDEQLEVQHKGYSLKSEEFQQLINESNKYFVQFQGQMESNSNQIRNYQSNNQDLANQLERSNRAFLQYADDHVRIQSQLETQKQQLEGLKNLLKQLEAQLENMK